MNISHPLQSRFGNRNMLGRRGQSLVEFAMVAPLFFLLVFAIIDIGRVFFVQVTLQNAVRQAGRFAVTGNRLIDSSTGTEMSRIASIIQIAKNAAVGLDVTSIQVRSSSSATTAGGPGDTVTISLKTDLKLITPLIGRFFGPGGIYSFTVSTVFRNEPFPPDKTL